MVFLIIFKTLTKNIIIMSELKVGDVVTLKSGSIDMTIYQIYNNNEYAHLTWFDPTTNTIKAHEGVPTVALKK